MPDGKSFGDGEGLLTIIGIIIGLGVAFMLFAVVYKVMTSGGDGRGYSFRSNKPPGNGNAVSPAPTSTEGDSPTAISAISNGNQNLAHVPPQLDMSHTVPRRSGPTVVSGEEDAFEVDAVIISNRTKVPKHGRTIITPRATVVPVVEALPYESDMESQAGSARSDRPIARAALDHRAPAWYDSDVESQPAQPRSDRQDAPVVLDPRAPSWYNDD